MKTKDFNSFKVGFNSVIPGQRNAKNESELIFTSTPGGIRVTGAVTSALNLQAGDYITFINNINGLNNMVLQKDEQFIAFANEMGLEVDSIEAQTAFIKEFEMWGITKGFVEYDTKGNAKTTTERLTKNDKETFVLQNFNEFLEQAIENFGDEVKEALTREDVTKEEQVKILCDYVEPKEILKYRGSKLGSPNNMVGVGVNLNFSDSNIWQQIKGDLGEDATKLNRIFDIDVNEIQKISLFDGYKEVECNVLFFKEYRDESVADKGRKKEHK